MKWLEQHAVRVFFIFLAGALVYGIWLWLKAPPDRTGEPIIGHWLIRVGPDRCAESYTFSADGSLYQTSRERVAEERFQTRMWEGNPLLWEYKGSVVNDSGGADCSGQRRTTADKNWANLLRFSADFKSVQFCDFELKKCSPPLIRLD